MQAAQAALNGARPLALIDGVVCLQLDLACHCLSGIGHHLRTSYGKAEIADEIQTACDFLQKVKGRYLQSLQTKVVLAKPGDVPPTPKIQ